MREITGNTASKDVITLVSDNGDRRVLQDWLQAAEAYTALADDGDLRTVPFDCCVLDVDALLEHGTVLADRKADASVPLPILLLIPESRAEDVEHHLQQEYPQRWSLVDGVLRTPLTQIEFEMRLTTLCRLQQQSAALNCQQEQLQQRGEQLAVLNRVLRHDVRNEMTVVLGLIETLEDHVDESGKHKTVLNQIQTAADHVVELTTDAREFVDTIYAEEDLDLKPMALADVLSEEIERRQTTFEEATIDLREPLPAVTVEANELLGSVFRNLINNAVQHNDTDEPKVTVEVEDQGPTVVVRVADNGPGIPKKHREQLLSAETRGLEGQGTGMGLYLVERLVDLYGGDIWAEDNTPRGAVFVVEFPKAASESLDMEGN
ncbi:MAG: signal transduction histidine kinase [Natronomonas sp.]|jgi:signal transduction histidine kinase